ncbi:unnamed protein product [Lactuca saligna]|uniref:Replication protein A OB domain-containing protein n=1 Tax=Lactuca saligna TaxID=75948 RepID=A0AA36E5V0_LACSI|nr:unnamed protein product [Lactuca saligna]
MTTINFDTHVAFDFIGQVVSTEPKIVIKENARETRLMSIVPQDLSGRKMQVVLWDSFALTLNSYISEHQNENALMIILLCMVKFKTLGARISRKGESQVGRVGSLDLLPFWQGKLLEEDYSLGVPARVISRVCELSRYTRNGRFTQSGRKFPETHGPEGISEDRGKAPA